MPARDRPLRSELTVRERQVLQLMGQGHTYAAIAKRLGVSMVTVAVHRRNLLKKLGARNTAQLLCGPTAWDTCTTNRIVPSRKPVYGPEVHASSNTRLPLHYAPQRGTVPQVSRWLPTGTV